jgi:hypothetical protein
VEVNGKAVSAETVQSNNEAAEQSRQSDKAAMKERLKVSLKQPCNLERNILIFEYLKSYTNFCCRLWPALSVQLLTKSWIFALIQTSLRHP